MLRHKLLWRAAHRAVDHSSVATAWHVVRARGKRRQALEVQQLYLLGGRLTAGWRKAEIFPRARTSCHAVATDE